MSIKDIDQHLTDPIIPIVFHSQMNSALEQLEKSVSEMIALYAGREGRCCTYSHIDKCTYTCNQVLQNLQCRVTWMQTVTVVSCHHNLTTYFS